MEDLLESIVGNIQDEFDHEEEEVTRLSDTAFDIDGSLDEEELDELLDKMCIRDRSRVKAFSSLRGSNR